MDDKDNKRGFTGLSDLTSDVESVSSRQHKDQAESPARVKVEVSREPESRQLPGESNASSRKPVKPVSGGLFSGITKFLLAIPWQLYLVGGVAGYFYYQDTIEDRVIDSFQGKIGYYLTRSADSNTTPRLIPGVLPVDLKTRAVDRMYFRLKDAYKPKSAADVSSVVGFKCSDEVVGSYSDGASGYQKSCGIYVIEVGNHTWSYVGNFTGSEPPDSKKGSGSRTGSHPARDYLRKAGVM
ncbi:MAG: hypothetical protein G8D88_10445 [gamma proteobacterium symbiont of Ctena orbiculata]